jgi:hypothetical protein
MKRFHTLFALLVSLMMTVPALAQEPGDVATQAPPEETAEAPIEAAVLAATVGDLSVEAPKPSNGLTLGLNWTVQNGGELLGIQVQRHADGSEEWESTGDILDSSATTFEDSVPDAGTWTYQLLAVKADGTTSATLSATVSGSTKGTWLNTNPAHMMLLGLIVFVGALMTHYTKRAQRGEEIYIRRIPGIDAIEEGIGRATEMGKPVLYVPGIDDLQDIQTIASMLILGQVSKTVAEYQADLIVSCCIPIVREVADEVVRAGYYQAGHPDAYNAANIRFISSEQFAFCAGTNGIMLREKPATNIYFGRFFAESLILAETGFVNRSIQIAGTAEATQLPFFIAACDYTLIGEELFAVSAYLSKDPRLVSSLKASDIVKAVCVAALIIGTVLATFENTFLIDLFKISG